MKGRLGQMMNGDKTAIFFSHNTSADVRSDILLLFGTSMATKFEKYLGLPPCIRYSYIHLMQKEDLKIRNKKKIALPLG